MVRHKKTQNQPVRKAFFEVAPNYAVGAGSCNFLGGKKNDDNQKYSSRAAQDILCTAPEPAPEKPRGATRAEISYALAEINLEITGYFWKSSRNQLKGNQKSEVSRAAHAQAHGNNWKSVKSLGNRCGNQKSH